MRQNKNTRFCIGGPGLDRIDEFQKFCGTGLDRNQLFRMRTGLGMKNFTVRSSLLGTLDYSILSVLFSVEHDPEPGLRSNRILHIRTGTGLDLISKKTQRDQIWQSKLH